MYDRVALTDPDYWPKLISLLEEHFRGYNFDAEFEADALDHAIRVDEPCAWDHAEVLAKLDDLERALSAPWEILLDLPQDVRGVFMAHAILHSPKIRSTHPDDPASPMEAAFAPSRLSGLLRPCIEKARQEAVEGLPKGRTRWGPVNAIIACRGCWKNCTGQDAPRSMNDGSPFGQFVADVFDLMQIDASPRAAMDAWRKIQSSPENP